MEEIEIGEYVRTDDGYIGKIVEINEGVLNPYVIDTKRKIRKDGYPETYIYTRSEFIKKHSKNIIDLIELGDLVELFMEEDVEADGIYEDTNIFEVISITTDKKQIGIFGNDLEIEFVPVGNLRSILTQEQYDANCYRLEE